MKGVVNYTPVTIKGGAEMTDTPDPKLTLPAPVIHLIHYVELHQSGWWDRALERLVQAVIWLGAPMTRDQVAEELNDCLQQRLPSDRFDSMLEQLIASGTVIVLAGNRLKLNIELEKAFAAESEEVQGSERSVEELILLTARTHNLPQPEELWSDFNEQFLDPMIAESGARVYDLLTGGADGQPLYEPHLASLIAKYGVSVRAALVDFLDPNNPSVRQYVLRRLNAAFVREAASLSRSVLDELAAVQVHHDRVRVLLDTNFVFSFLKLHDNPSNDVAEELLNLARRVSAYINVEFYVLPITIEEIRKVLGDSIARLEGVRPSAHLAQSAALVNPSGLANAYFQAAGSPGAIGLTAQEFFGPYESNLLAILRSNGIELYNEDLDALRVDPEVIDDLTAITEHQRTHRQNGPKPYDTNLHDMVLWHFTRRRRSSVAVSALDVNMWVATVDYGLIAFDRVANLRFVCPLAR